MVDTGDKVTRKYTGFRGVDFRGEECSITRSPDSLNVWRNYKKTASIETRPGMAHLATSTTGVKSMKWHKPTGGVEKLYFVANDGYLHALNADGSLDFEIQQIGANAILFEFDGKLYAKGEDNIYNVTEGKLIDPYIPTTSIGRRPSADEKTPSSAGTKHEDVNMLSDYRKNSFIGDGENCYFWLDAQPIDDTFHPVVEVNGEIYDGMYAVNYKKGYVHLPAAVGVSPSTDGQDNVVITFKKAVTGYREQIMNCTMAQEFDNRVFFGGNPDYPSTVWHSSLYDVSYCSDLDYYVDGMDFAPIRSMVAGNNGLWVFRDTTEATSGVFYHTPVLDEEYGKVYPSSHSSISIGCAGRAINFNDDIVFFSRRGMESASTDVTTEQFVTHRSSLVDRVMLSNPDYKDMILAEWEGYLFVFIGCDAFLADSRAFLSHENHMEYEWYHWNVGRYPVTCATVHNGVLYVGTDGDGVNGVREGHIYSFTREAKDGDEHSGHYPNGEKWEDRAHINSYWTTPKDRFEAPNKLKTTNKKGCVVEAIGDVSVYVKTDNDEEFELIGTNNAIEDYFVNKIKRKKFKDIQLKFCSPTAFSLEAATLECFIGGYIKR